MVQQAMESVENQLKELDVNASNSQAATQQKNQQQGGKKKGKDVNAGVDRPLEVKNKSLLFESNHVLFSWNLGQNL
jgi:hypothetical protein